LHVASVLKVPVVALETSWLSLPADVNGAIFAGGGPSEWEGPGQGFSVIEVDRNSRDGLPVRAVLQALAGAPLFRTDQLGSIEVTDRTGHLSVGR
jgi:hypothetical protein